MKKEEHMLFYTKTTESNTENQDLIRLTFFKDMFDNQVREVESFTWEELVETFAEHRVTEKKNDLGFIAGDFISSAEGARPAEAKNQPIKGSVGRYGENIRNMYCLVLDYDGGATMKEVRAQLEGVKHLGYTSYNHLKDGVTEKFRVIIPFATPCSGKEWAERRKGFYEFFPGIDSSAFSLGRIFYTPATPGGMLVFTWSEDGEPFDWTLIAPVVYEAPVVPHLQDYGVEFKDDILLQLSKCNFSEYEDWKALGSHLYHAGFGVEDYIALSRSDARKQCEGLWKWYERRGSPSGLGGVISRIRREFPGWTPPKEEGDAPVLEFVKKIGSTVPEVMEEPRGVEQREIVYPQKPIERVFTKPTAMHVRHKTVHDILESFLMRENNIGIVRTAEGYGKTTMLVEGALARGKKVLFCSASNKQADEKMIDFEHHEPHRVWSRGGLIEKVYGVKPVYKQQAPDEWGDPGLDIEATIEAVRKGGFTIDEGTIEDLGEKAKASRDFQDAPLLVTTFSMGDMLFRNSYGHLDRLVIVDDPSLGDLVTVRYEQENGFESPPTLLSERPIEDVVFGEEFWKQSKVLFTTTEQLVVQQIKLHHKETFLTDISEDLDTGDHVLIIPSTLVYKVTRKILPGIHAAVMDDTRSDQLLIVNGAGQDLNLINTKGRNDLKKDAVIIISRPHPCDVASVTTSLGLEIGDREMVARQMVVDLLNQAVGRSQAYRGSGGHRVLVICDPKLEQTLKTKCRYRLNTWEGMKRRGIKAGSPLVMHVETPPWWVHWFSYLTTWHAWVVVIGDKVYETLSMKRLGMVDDESRLIEKKLKKPTTFAHLVWKKQKEWVEGDGRRNFAVMMNELVDEFNKVDNRAKEATEVGKKNAGTFLYHSPDGSQKKRFAPGSEPSGWVTNSRILKKKL